MRLVDYIVSVLYRAHELMHSDIQRAKHTYTTGQMPIYTIAQAVSYNMCTRHITRIIHYMPCHVCITSQCVMMYRAIMQVHETVHVLVLVHGHGHRREPWA